jgi:hypothetical protein
LIDKANQQGVVLILNRTQVAQFAVTVPSAGTSSKLPVLAHIIFKKLVLALVPVSLPK